MEFGDYELLNEVGRGGMGVIYRARQRSLNRIVALKMILSGRFAGKESVERLRAEATAAAALRHPNIVAIHEIGEIEGQHYFTMDYVEGSSLAELVRERPFSAQSAVRYVCAIAEAMEYAHQRGTLHRDLKPSNVLIDEHDQPRITDFGLAKQYGVPPTTVSGATEPAKAGTASDLTLSGHAVGSPGYMPPEQALGKRSDIGPHSDVYAMGALLYHLLTGRAPFAAETLEATLSQALTNDPVPPRVLNPTVPRDLETICLKCLEKDLQRRYLSAHEFAEELRRFLDGKPIHARPVSSLEKSWRWCRRSPVIAGLAALALVLLVTGVSGILWQWSRAELFARSESSHRARAERALTQLELRRAEELLQEDQPSKVLAYFAKVLRKEPTNEAVATRTLSLLSQRSFALPVTRPMRHKARVNIIEFSPDGSRLASASADGTACIWNALTGDLAVGPLQHEADVAMLKFSRDGTRLVTASKDHTARIWDAATGRPVAPTVRHERLFSAEFNPDASKIVTASDDGTARVWSAHDGHLLFDPIHHHDDLFDATFSEDGKFILSSSTRDGVVMLSDANTGEVVRRFRVSGRLAAVRLSPDSDRVVIANAAEARIFMCASGREIAVLRHRAAIEGAVFSPDGGLIATVGKDRRAILWDAATGEMFAELPEHQTWIRAAGFSRDGLRLLTQETSNRALVWDVLTQQRICEPIHGDGLLYDARFSPDDEKVAIATLAGTVQVFSIGPRKAAPLTIQPTGSLYSVHFSSDGAKVITASSGGLASIWNATNAENERVLNHSFGVRLAQFAPDGRKVLTAAANRTELWDLTSGHRTMRTHESNVTSIAFSPAGEKFLVLMAGGLLRTWGTESGVPLMPQPIDHGNSIWHAEFSPDGKVVATGTGTGPDFSARTWDGQSGEPSSPLLVHGRGVRYVSFSPDGKRLVTASRDQTAAVWAIPSGKKLVEVAHNGIVRSARFSSDGRRIVTASHDNSARVWDAETGRPLTDSLHHDAEVHCAEFSPNGRYVLTASADGTARVWDVESGRSLSTLEHDPALQFARFLPDGRRVITSASTVRVWELPISGGNVPPWLPDFAEAVAGQYLDESGAIRFVDSTQLLRLRKQMESSNDTEVAARWARWMFEDRVRRTIAPSLSVSSQKTSEQLAQQPSLAGLCEAIRRAPTNSLAYTKLADLIARQQNDPQQQVRARVFSRRALALSPGNSKQRADDWVASATEETPPRDSAEWHRHGQLLIERGAWSDAVAAFRKARELAEPRIGSLYQRSVAGIHDAVFQFKPRPEATREWLSVLKIPERDSQTPPMCIDLSPHYNAALHDPWQNRAWASNHLSILPRGRQTFCGLEFDVRGVVQLGSQGTEKYSLGFPSAVTGIRVGRKCRALHFFHGAGHAPSVPTPVHAASYWVNFADGASSEIKLVTGQDLREWHEVKWPHADLPGARLAWAGTNSAGAMVGLYLKSWQNPRPDVAVTTIDFSSAMQLPGPFLVAVTAEP